MIEQMKKFFSIFFAAMLAVACVEPLQPYHGLEDHGGLSMSNGPKMIMEFSIPISSPATKGAMTDQPQITTSSNVHVFVYNAVSGALLQVSKATLKGTVTVNTPWGTAESDITNHADFIMGSAHRYLQVVVDAPTYSTEGSTNDNETGIGYEDNPIYLGDSEADVASKLYTTGGATAYWQRIDLPHGLQAYTYPGGTPEKGVEGTDWTSFNSGGDDDKTNDWYLDKDGDTVNYGDFVNSTGQKITDGTGYVMSTDVANRVKFIPLVRNFVKIKVSKADDGTFTPKKAVLINVPASGYIAPYSSASGFVSFYQKDLYLERLQIPADPEPGVQYGTQGIVATGYTAPVPNDEYDTACPDESKCVSADNGVISLYMYERGVATSNPTQLLVYGRFDDSSEDCWLKIDITDTDGHYIAFYRDLTYDMEIGAITGTAGYDLMQAAYDMPSVGNPSSSPETQTLTRVSDGHGTEIWVDYIDHASFEKNANSVRLRYKFVGYDGSTSANAELSVEHKTGTHAVTSSTLTGAPYDGTTDTQDQQGGWYYVNVPLAAQGSTVMRSVVRVSGTATNNVGKTVTLYRDVTFSVMPTQTMTVSMSPLEADEMGKPTTATITLQDGLGYSLFPLVIRIEAKNGSLTPTDSDLPVGKGQSTFSTLDSDDPNYRTSNYYWYEKTISYSDYSSGTRTYTANFKTIYNNGNETVVAFSDPDGHFNTAVTNLRGKPTFRLASDETTLYAKASETTASFDILSNVGTWTINADNGAEVVRTRANNVEGSGNATIMVSFPNNMNGSTTKEYHVTATLDEASQALVENYHDLEITISQATAQDNQLSTNTNSSTLTDDSYTNNGVSVTFGGTYGSTTDYIQLNKTESYVVVSATDKIIEKITITWAANPANTTTDPNNNGTVNNGTTTTTWTANNNASPETVRLNFTRTSGNAFSRIRISKIAIDYQE